MDSNDRVALPDVVDYFIDFYEDRKAHGLSLIHIFPLKPTAFIWKTALRSRMW